jgi:hypothetical protein
MRKLALVTTLAVALSAGLAQAVTPDQTMTIKTSPTKAGTKKKPRNVTLDVTTTTTPKANEPAFAVARAQISFDKNLVFNAKKFPSCAQDKVEDPAGAKCPAGSKIGGGSAKALVGGPGGQNADLSVTAYNGPGGDTLYLLVKNQAFNVNKALVGTLRKGSGKYGKKLDVVIPGPLQQVAGLSITLTEFKVKVKATRKGVPYVGLAGCTGRKLNYTGAFFYSDGSAKRVDATSKCS